MDDSLTIDEANINSGGLEDSYLVGMSWESEGRDFCLHLRLADGRSAKLICTWAAGIRVDLDYEEDKGGPPLSLEASVERVDQRRRFVCGFPPEGVIDLFCNEVSLTYET